MIPERIKTRMNKDRPMTSIYLDIPHSLVPRVLLPASEVVPWIINVAVGISFNSKHAHYPDADLKPARSRSDNRAVRSASVSGNSGGRTLSQALSPVHAA